MAVQTIEFANGKAMILDQRLLPHEVKYLECATPEEVAAAIRDMAIRGAPAIGIAAAYGLALAAANGPDDPDAAIDHFHEACGLMAAARPTAVNLFWAIDRMRELFDRKIPFGINVARKSLFAHAVKIHQDDVAACRAMGILGRAFVPDGARILTHCNAGALATGGYGTALGVIRAAVEDGKEVSVIADETRPWLQGARLTAWELAQDGIDVKLACDGMAGHLMSRGLVDLVIVGADRITANGDAANKIGTYSLAVLAREHRIAFYVAVPLSSIDLSLTDGSHIKIEERSPEEVTHYAGRRIAPDGVSAFNPVFDVTPAHYITAIITEKGIAMPPTRETVAALFADEEEPVRLPGQR